MMLETCWLMPRANITHKTHPTAHIRYTPRNVTAPRSAPHAPHTAHRYRLSGPSPPNTLTMTLTNFFLAYMRPLSPRFSSVADDESFRNARPLSTLHCVQEEEEEEEEEEERGMWRRLPLWRCWT